MQLCCFHAIPLLFLPFSYSFLSCHRQNRAIQTWTKGLFKPVTSIEDMRASVSLTPSTRIQPLPQPKPFCSNPVCRSRSRSSRSNNEKCTSEGSSLETQTKQVMRETVRKAWQQGLTPVPYISPEPSSLKLQEVTVQCMQPTGGGLKAKLGAAVPVLSRFFFFDRKNYNPLTSLFIFPCNLFYLKAK